MRILLIGAVSLVAVAGSAAFCLDLRPTREAAQTRIHTKDAQPKRSAAPTSFDNELARQERIALAQSVEDLKQQVAQLSHDTAPTPTNAEVAAENARQDVPSQAELELALRTELDATLAGEARDTEWATTAEDEVQQLIAATSDEAQDVSTTCRTTLCRSELTLGDEQAHAQFVATFTSDLRWPGAGYVYSVEEAGKQRTVLYLTKPGVALPQPPQMN
jgi:hypothetical protein